METYIERDDSLKSDCSNCGWEGPAGQCSQTIPRFSDRVAAGETMPVGECPLCGALAHYRDSAAPDSASPAPAGENKRATCSTGAACSDAETETKNAQGEPMRVRAIKLAAACPVTELWVVELKSGATGKWITQGEHLTEAAARADMDSWN